VNSGCGRRPFVAQREQIELVCSRFEQACAVQQLPSLGCHARLRLAQAAARGGDHARAQQVLEQAIGGIEMYRPMYLSLPIVWWLAAEVHRAAGRHDEAREACGHDVAWIDAVALPNVPPEWQASFLHDHPVHRSLRAAAGPCSSLGQDDEA
jgi:hypothetical protein